MNRHQTHEKPQLNNANLEIKSPAVLNLRREMETLLSMSVVMETGINYGKKIHLTENLRIFIWK